MHQTLRLFTLLVGTALVMPSLTGCGGTRSTGKATYGSGSGGTSWIREVKYAVDGNGHIGSRGTTATLTFAPGKLLIEKSRILLDAKELAPLAEDARSVEVDYTAGVLTITADGKKVHEAKLR